MHVLLPELTVLLPLSVQHYAHIPATTHTVVQLCRDELVWDTQELHMKHIDRFNTWIVTAYVTATRVRLMLL